MDLKFKVSLLQNVKTKDDLFNLAVGYNLINSHLINLNSLFQLLGFPKLGMTTKIKNYASKCGIENEAFIIRKEDKVFVYFGTSEQTLALVSYYKQLNAVFGKGIVEGNYPFKINNADKEAFVVWMRMLERCYSDDWHHKNPEDKGLSVSKSWQLFGNFSKWFNEYYKDGLVLTHNLLIQDNKTYSATKCLLVPCEISDLFMTHTSDQHKYPLGVEFRKKRQENRFEALFTFNGHEHHIGFYHSLEEASGAYKQNKETFIKQIAKEYYEKDLIDQVIYDALLKYEVIIDTSNRTLPKQTTDLLSLVRDERDLMPYLVDNGAIDGDVINIRKVLSHLGLAKHSYSNRMRWYLDKLEIPDSRVKKTKEGRFKEFVLSYEDASRMIVSIAQDKLAYNHGINDYTGQVVFREGILPSYRKWCGMLERCYSDKWHANKPTYKECFVSDDWLYFSNFKKWFDQNNVEGYVLDKDILFKDNKEYSADTCVFVPEYINSLFIKKNASRGKYPIGVYKIPHRSTPFKATVSHKGKIIDLGCFKTPELAFLAYKRAKEDYIKVVAEEYFGKGLIGEDVYAALLKYEVSITD